MSSKVKKGKKKKKVERLEIAIEDGTAAIVLPTPNVRHAVAVDPEIREKNLKRLRRIEGQIRGLHRMVEENLYCADVMTQIASVQEALRSVGRELVRNHMKHCAAEAMRSEDPAQAEAMHEELLDMVYRLGR